MTNKLLCFGLGYTASFLAQTLQAEGWEVAGTSRSQPLTPEMLEGAAYLLSSVPPDAEGNDPILCQHAEEIAARAKELRWVGYLSSTSVYGDTEGAWVDESAPTLPATRRGSRRLMAERAWQALGERYGVPVHIFRVSGIYGPGRNALHDVLAGKAKRIFKEGQVFSRIHVEDLARVLRASIGKPQPGDIYNVADDLPAPAWEVVEYACHLLGMTPPPLIPYEQAELSPMARSFYEASRRVSNLKMQEELGVELRYPDYRRGLEAMREAEQARVLHKGPVE